MAVTRSKAAERVQATYGPLRKRPGPASEFLWLIGVSIVIASGLFLVFKAKSHTFPEIDQGLASRLLLNLNALSSREDLLPFLTVVGDPGERQFVARRIYDASGSLPNVGALARMRAAESDRAGCCAA